ncbi:hypothetical protein F383_30407 [Gossypium arboreum]|uniref:Uncharacterized protein n=1 Tax=Gossypium arboreum TaxID=29729 RepID=A0A0B0N0Y2_GOSAR|nr:hypothetical protein F383_30407 [Gossypium arboreum]
MLIHKFICKLPNLFDLKLIICIYIPVPICTKPIPIQNTVEYSKSRTLSAIHSRSYLESHTKCHT